MKNFFAKLVSSWDRIDISKKSKGNMAADKMEMDRELAEERSEDARRQNEARLREQMEKRETVDLSEEIKAKPENGGQDQ